MSNDTIYLFQCVGLEKLSFSQHQQGGCVLPIVAASSEGAAEVLVRNWSWLSERSKGSFKFDAITCLLEREVRSELSAPIMETFTNTYMTRPFISLYLRSALLKIVPNDTDALIWLGMENDIDRICCFRPEDMKVIPCDQFLPHAIDLRGATDDVVLMLRVLMDTAIYDHSTR